MKTKQPKVSVVMPVYNAARFVAEAIESILSQEYRNFELIIVNDASSDESGKVIAKYKKLAPRKMRVVTLKANVNQGGDAAGNIGYRLARGKYIARMDADDMAEPDRLVKQVAFMEANPSVAVLGSQATVINTEGYVVGKKAVPMQHEAIEREFFTFHPMIHPTVMVRKSAVKRRDLYLTDYQANNDYLTFFSLITHGAKFANLADPLLRYRIHGKNDSLARVKRNFWNSLRIRSRAVREWGYRPSMLAVAKLVAQALIVMVLPEAWTVQLYLLIRGIVSWREVVAQLVSVPFTAKLKSAWIQARQVS